MSKPTPLPLLACLLLPACAPKDPEGMLEWQTGSEYTSKEAIVMEFTNRGDSAPFRLKRGDYSILILKPSILGADLAFDCSVTLKLRPYGGGEERTIVKEARLGVEETRLNGVKAGIYSIYIEASESYCSPNIVITRP